MPGKTYASETRKADYKMRKDGVLSTKNASKRLVRHLSKHPNDVQSATHVVPKSNKQGGYIK